MRIPSSGIDLFHRHSHPIKTVRSVARGHGHRGFSRPMSVERLEARLPLSSTPVGGPIPSAAPAETVAGNPAFQAIAGGDETNQSLAQTSFIAGGPAAGIGPAGAGGSGGIGGGIVETGFTGTEFSPFNLPAGAFGGVHEGVIGEGPESTGNPSNDTRGAGPGAISNPAGSQMEWPGFNPYAVAETANFGAAGRFGPDTGYPAPLPDDALLPRLFPRVTTPVPPTLGDQNASPEADAQGLKIAAILEIGWGTNSDQLDGQTPAAVATPSQPDTDDAPLVESTSALDEYLLSQLGDGRGGSEPYNQPPAETSRPAAGAGQAERADRVMADLTWKVAEPETEVVEAGTSAQASIMSAALVTVAFDGSRVRDHFWRTAAEPKQHGKRLGR